MPDRRVVRAWLVGHHGFAFLFSTGVLTLGLWLFATESVPGVTGGPPIPLWALGPPAYAGLASITTLDSIPVVGRDRVVRIGRACWLGVVLAVSVTGTAAVGAATGLASLPLGTGLLVALTFASAPVLGVTSVVVAAVPAVAIVILTRSVDGRQASIWDPSTAPAVWVALALLCMAGCASYVRRGEAR